MRKRITITIESVERGGIKGQLVATGKGRGVKVKFDLIEDLYKVNEGEKIIIEFRETPPGDTSGYIFCGHGFIVRDLKREAFEEPQYTIFSVWGLLFRFEPSLEGLEPENKYYICIKKA